MRRHVGHGAVAEIPHPSPHEGGQLSAVRPHGPRAEPEVPVEPGGLDGRPLARPDVRGCARRAAPGVHFTHGADRAVLDPLDGLAMPLARTAVVTHLRRDLGLLRDPRHDARLTNVVRERLLAVHMLARLHRKDGDVRVQVIGGGDEDGVNRLFFLEHDPEVLVHRTGMIRGLGGIVLFDFRLHRAASRFAAVVPRGQVPLVGRIGERDDLAVLFLEEGARVGPPLAAGADQRHVDLVARGDELGAAEDMSGHDGESGGGSARSRDEPSSGTGRRLHGASSWRRVSGRPES